MGTGEADGENQIATMRRGQSFGEGGFSGCEGLRSASACTAQGYQLLIIPRDKPVMRKTYPQLEPLMYNLAADLTMNSERTDLHIRERYSITTR